MKENDLLKALLACRDAIEVRDLLGPMSPTDFQENLPDFILYLAALAEIPFEGDWYEFGIWGYEIEFPEENFSTEVSAFVEAGLAAGTWKKFRDQVDAIRSVCFADGYEDWWDSEAFDWGGSDDVSLYPWFNKDELIEILAIWDQLAPVMGTHSFILTMYRLSLTDLMTTGARYLQSVKRDKRVAPDISVYQLRLLLKSSRLIHEHFPEDPLGIELMCQIYKDTKGQFPELLNELWSNCKELGIEWKHLDQLLSLSLASADGKEAGDQWGMLDQQAPKQLPSDLSTLQLAVLICGQHPDSVFVKNFLANLEVDLDAKRNLRLEILEKLPPMTYFVQEKGGGLGLTHRLDHYFWLWGLPIIDHFKVVFSLQPGTEIEPLLRALITELQSKTGVSDNTERLTTMLDQWGAEGKT